MAAAVDNRFLSSLSPSSRDLVLSHGTAVPLPLKTSLYRAGEPAPFVFILTSGLASIVTSMQDGGVAEVGMIGNEGMTASVHLLGPSLAPTNCMMQMQGTGIRVPSADMRGLFRSSDEIRNRLLEFIQQQNLMVSQIAGCNRLHTAEERLSRWLLMAFDRSAGNNTLDFTQEFLADMLGARRSTVTLVTGALQRSGLIEHERGRVRIVDRDRLEKAACDCYPILKQLHFDLYRDANRPARSPNGSA